MKKIIFTTFGIITLYYVTLFAFGVTSLGKRLAKDSNATFHIYRWTNNIKVVGNVDMKPISQKFNYEGVRVKVIRANSYDEMRPHILDKDTYHYILLTNSKHLPVIMVEEAEHINEYVAEWEKSYVWCFVAWIRIHDKLIGIS